MPVYENLDYPAFERYAQILRYVQARNGTVLLHPPVVRVNQFYLRFVDSIKSQIDNEFNQRLEKSQETICLLYTSPGRDWLARLAVPLPAGGVPTRAGNAERLLFYFGVQLRVNPAALQNKKAATL